MKIRIVGAAGGEVTGSAYVVQSGSERLLVDAGMFQGGKASEAKNRLPAGVDVSRLDAILLTHAHLDHTGRVPLLIKHGFRGKILATAATLDLAEIILKDSAKLQMFDAARARRRKRDYDREPPEPLYGPEDVAQLRRLTRVVPFNERVSVTEGISARWLEAGHMLGSGSIELTVEERGSRRIIVFSGDLGPAERPIIRDFQPLKQADLVFLESTYGDRDHRPYAETVSQFEEIVKHASARGGRILVPSFAVGRSQQILYHLAVMFHRGQVRPFHVYVDSPMAIEASKTFTKHADLFDDELTALRKEGLLPLNSSWFQTSASARESQALQKLQGSCLILAGAGMCNAGRILNHFRNALSRESTHVLMVGYQGKGSLGRRLVDGAKSVSIHGERVEVRAAVHTLNGFSAHAGRSDLLKWFSSLAPSRPRVVLTHGEDKPRAALADAIRLQFGLRPEMPVQGAAFEL
jgi:metallo-beta-lactamase family protein